jgi:hypothetical protein
MKRQLEEDKLVRHLVKTKFNHQAWERIRELMVTANPRARPDIKKMMTMTKMMKAINKSK